MDKLKFLLGTAITAYVLALHTFAINGLFAWFDYMGW